MARDKVKMNNKCKIENIALKKVQELSEEISNCITSNRFDEIPKLDKSRLDIIKNFKENDNNKLKEIISNLISKNSLNIQELEKKKNNQLKKYYETAKRFSEYKKV